MTTSLFVPGPAGRLEAAIDEPVMAARAIAVLCHPHPLYGGSLDDGVLATAAGALLAAGVSCLRFNFRGVGASDGEHDGGRGETDDALAALAYCAAQRPHLPRLLLGYSFGAMVAWRAAQPSGAADPLERLLLVAPVMGRAPLAGVAPGCPVHVIAGSDDRFVNWQTLAAWADALATRPAIARIDGCDHFFSGQHAALADAVTQGLAH
jgi:hypothetical protein